MGGVGLGRGVRVDVNEMKIQKKIWGGGGGRGRGWWGVAVGLGGQSGCERRIELFVKIQKKKNFFFLGGGGRGGRGGRRGGGGSVGGSGSGWGVRVDVNEELKFLLKFKKKNLGGGVGSGGG